MFRENYRTATVRSCEKIATITELAGESACPTLLLKTLETCGAGAFACQPIFSRLLREPVPELIFSRVPNLRSREK